ncbi:hypothetical protein [Mycobacterium sp.]|uniref:hypothetical protein n=1 Tax=Mycobacterium sp. TaxID=1785 RepID=UPI002D866AA3|nr:hypothetical protein [Mycobacterium sp.]
MSGAHPDLGPELRQLAQTILDRLDPAVRMAAARAASSAGSSQGPPKCQQVWCPVCALAALVSGEQHPLLSVVAEHSVALLTVIRALIEDTADTTDGKGPPESPQPPSSPGGPDGDEPPPQGPGRYQHIPVSVEE